MLLDLNICRGTVDGGGRRDAAAYYAGPGGVPMNRQAPVTAVGKVAACTMVATDAQIYALKAFAHIAYVLY